MSRARIARSVSAALSVSAAALLLAGCASSHKDAPPKVKAAAITTPSSSAAASSAPATTASTSAAAATGALSGSWTGQYGGSFQGTFKLNWQQSTSNLSGTIQLSNPPGSLAIHGSVNGSTISFGTVGSTDITYTGSVSGSSMSGTYKVATPNGSAGGTWSASRN
jgi:uncharacterized protein YukE